MHTSLVSIPTETIPLEGAWYEPEGAPKGAVLLFHGNTMNFYVGAPRFLPPVLTRLGLACLAFNRRGHDIMSTFNSRIAVGGAYQSTAEAIADNRTAAQWLAARGFADPIVIGHSNGGMLGVRHAVDHPRTPALVLLSAGRGGTRSTSAGPERLFAGDRQEEFTAQARELVKAGRGTELMLIPGWWYVITAESFLDRIVSVPDTLALAPQVKCPVLTLRGDQEDGYRYPAEEFQKLAGGPCRAEIVADCDHFYNGREEKVADLVADWIGKTLGLEW